MITYCYLNRNTGGFIFQTFNCYIDPFEAREYFNNLIN